MIVTVANLKGGVGKTTTAVYLAAVAAEHGRTVILADADPQASAAEWHEQTPINRVQLVECPSARLVHGLTEYDADNVTIVIDTPPGSERIASAAIGRAHVVIVPTRAGSIEIPRVQATREAAGDTPCGLAITSAKPWTRNHIDTVSAWTDVGVPVWGSIPERVAVALGPDAPLHPDALEAHRLLYDAATAAAVTA